jgi:hypothetical protein
MRRQLVVNGIAALQRAAASTDTNAAAVAASWCMRHTRSFADGADLKKTALFDFHVAHGGGLGSTVTEELVIYGLCMIMLSSESARTTKRGLLPQASNTQARWCHSLDGQCPSSTRIPSWSRPCTAARTRVCLMCPTCVRSLSRSVGGHVQPEQTLTLPRNEMM